MKSKKNTELDVNLNTQRQFALRSKNPGDLCVDFGKKNL